jgi:hypothetical protein
MSADVKNWIAFAVTALVVLGIIVYFGIASIPHKSLQVSSDPATAASAHTKLDHIKSVEYGPDQRHRTETATEMFTDAELTWLANDRVQRSKLPVEAIVVQTNDDGTLESQFKYYVGPIIFPVYVRFRASVQGNQVNIEILESKFGQWDVPAVASNGLRQALDQIYGLSREHTKNFDDITLSITQNRLQVTVVGSPHPDRPHPGYS